MSKKQLAPLEAWGAKAAECHRAGSASFAERDALILQAYEACPLRGTKQRAGFKEWCEKWELPYATAKLAVQAARDPAVRPREAAKAKVRRKKPDVGPNPTAPQAPSPSRSGEIHEAVLGFKAGIQRAAKATAGADIIKWRTFAFQHLKFVLSQTNLATVAGVTADEITNQLSKL